MCHPGAITWWMIVSVVGASVRTRQFGGRFDWAIAGGASRVTIRETAIERMQGSSVRERACGGTPAS